MNSDRERLFLKHFALASKRMQGRQIAQNNQKAQAKPQSKITDFQNQLNEILEKENILIKEQEEESNVTKEMKEKVTEMEQKMGHMSKYDSELIFALKKEIAELEDEIKLLKQEKLHREGDSKKQVELLYKGIAETREKMQEFISKREEHEQRVLELEEKIKQGVSNNYLELLHLEQHLENMEKKYNEFSEDSRYDQTMLDQFREKIVELKSRIWRKKSQLAEKKEMPIIPPPRFVFPKKIKHELKIKPVEFMPEPPKPKKASLLKKFFKNFPP
ncbi:hypothetical protein KY317_02410 [Candidatus Woesearchaeota archaeon]|nr:hypothetical protein [Candidatus Woesearchaeota archaeon]